MRPGAFLHPDRRKGDLIVKKPVRLLVCLMLALAVLLPAGLYAAPKAEAASAKTGPGLAAHALRAVNENWRYVYGGYGQISGGTRVADCAGLIKSYLWWTDDSSNPRAGAVAVAGGANSMRNSASVAGSINRSDLDSIPNIHGLIVYHSGHVGVYVGGNMAVDCRNSYDGIKYQKVCGPGSYRWTAWFKLPQVQYPNTGWIKFNGQSFYYENGEYVENVTKTIGGVDYTFGADGALIGGEPPAEDYLSVDYTPAAVQSTAKETSTASAPQPVVYQIGSQGSVVGTIQTRLKELGYFWEDVTNYYGEITAEAVRAFQQQAGLSQTGKTDETTLSRLKADGAPVRPALTEGDAGDDVSRLQQRLAELLYFEETPDGGFGPVTAEAVAAFQTANGLEATGKAGLDTLTKLYSDAAAVNPDAGTLRPGKKGEKVSALQARLCELRYLTAYECENGLFDEATEAAVRAYQQAAGLEATGELREEEQEALYAEAAVPSPDWTLLRKGFSGEDVAALQQDLLELHLYEGTVDGVFGDVTEAALKAFQAKRGLEETGIVGMEVREELEAALFEQETLATVALRMEKMLAPPEPSPVRSIDVPQDASAGVGVNFGLMIAVTLGGMLSFSLLAAAVFRRRELGRLLHCAVKLRRWGRRSGRVLTEEEIFS